MKLHIPFVGHIKNPLSKRKYDTSGDSMNIHRDWAIGLGFAALFFIGGVTVIVLDFYTQFGIEADMQNNPAKNLPTYSASEVRAFAQQYSEKSVVFEKLRNEIVSLPVTKQTASTTTDTPQQVIAPKVVTPTEPAPPVVESQQ
jgi:cytoskeletal protein RodZ